MSKVIEETFEKQKWFLINELMDLQSCKTLNAHKRNLMSQCVEDLKMLFEAHTLMHELHEDEEEEENGDAAVMRVRTTKPITV